MRQLIIVLIVCVASACASPGVRTDVPQRPPQRTVDPDVVDIRGIWRDTRLNRQGAVARGLDPDRIQTPRKVRDQRPVYPEAALRDETSGTVTLDCIINMTGAPEDCEIVRGPQALRAAALEAVMAWRWDPLRVDGVPRRAAALLTVSFTLQVP